jgi:hypothetical protein
LLLLVLYGWLLTEQLGSTDRNLAVCSSGCVSGAAAVG